MFKPVVLEDVTGGSGKATNLCVLVYGLWGNPTHMRNVAKVLRDKYSEERLYILPAEKNCGNFTYDGIEIGGERVCAEIEAKLRSIKEQGGKITKLSMAGYSLGGLVSRYAVGLLDAKGILGDLECMNVPTFAISHLGVRTPLKGWLNNVRNVLGARTLSMSGRQLFTIDKFRDTNRPLLAVLADPDSMFMSGLKKFKRRTLYTNIANDRSVLHYTSAITKYDPYTDLEKINLNYLEGYEDAPLKNYKALKKWFKNILFMATVGIIMPIGLAVFLVYSAAQTTWSAIRINAHESGEAGFEDRAVPHVPANSGGSRRSQASLRGLQQLTEPALDMIENLSGAGWRTCPVHIQKHRHSHAAIVVRMDKKGFVDGWVVLRHFDGSEFVM
ncbi:related to lipase/serine esterase [Fusarium mangiferae]|uniref:Related to lipase/serine esterase n=1 Tax=Fusarium mangiferae TaxID=192010 RepID=A0A1L7UEG1_FUSMA|nr:uncharacterized protein FMAN_14294 [Fusarium mangiferae]CVL09028.1 related to lipase/serine esterase [Fusarium mangiferae]